MHNVDYRFDKLFSGIIKDNEKEYFSEVLFFCRKLEYLPDFTKFDKYVKNNSIAKTIELGRGSIVTISCQDVFTTFTKLYANNKNIMIQSA